MVNPSQIHIDCKPSIDEVKDFINKIGDSIDAFKYFNSRPFSIIENHLVTILLSDSNQNVGYGHLEIENDIVWLGIAIDSQKKGKGYGNQIMNYLISYYLRMNTKTQLFLTVHSTNKYALILFEKWQFKKQYKINDKSYLMKFSKNG